MRWLITRGLCLALALVGSRLQADEIQWRAAPRPVAQTPPEAADPGAFVSLQRPVPIMGPGPHGADRKVTPVSFEAASLDTPRPLVRAQRADVPQPMPTGPSLAPEEILGKPRPLSKDTGKAPPASESDIVSRWMGDGSEVLGHGSPGVVGDGGWGCGSCSGDACGPICCDPCGPVCCDGGCCPNGCCKDRGHFWASAEYLLWAFKRDNIPPLVTAAPPGVPGAIGQPGTAVVFGGGGPMDNNFSGGRFTLGFWCGNCSDVGLEASYFFLGQRTNRFIAASDGSVSLGRPINVVNNTFDALGRLIPPGENVEQIALAGMSAGGVMVDVSSRLWGAELNGRYKWCCGDTWHVDFLAGFRYVELDEGIHISEAITTLADNSFRAVSDRFDTRNQFYGGQIGLDGEWRWRRWFFEGQAKLALGDQSELVRIAGNTQFIPPAPATAVTRNGGVLALASNSGTFTKDRFAVIPELGVKIGYQVTDHLRIFAGYDFMYISRVVRPGDQIDRNVNTLQLPNVFQDSRLVQPAFPAVLFKETDFWAQGLNAGLELRY
jgi:hypothetical protein